MKDLKRLIIGGLSILGLTAVGYRTYELRKLRKEIKEEEIIDIQPEVIEESRK